MSKCFLLPRIFFGGILFILCPFFLYGKIYDCFIFFNELELLDVRLHELYDEVDYFVLVESVETFRGKSKPLYYDTNKAHFEKFSDKIIHVIVKDRIQITNPWIREEFQRNQIMQGLVDCDKNDIIMISDVDEIIRSNAISPIIKAVKKENGLPVVCQQTPYRFFLNTWESALNWAGTCALTYHELKKTSPHMLRLNRNNGGPIFYYPVISNSGWHFISLGGLERYILKTESISHSEFDLPMNKTGFYMSQYLNENCLTVPIDGSFPKYIRDHLDFFIENGFVLDRKDRNN